MSAKTADLNDKDNMDSLSRRELTNPQFATAREAAGFLNISRAQVHALSHEGKIPARRYGNAVRIPWTWLWAQVEEYSPKY
jgi:excisionase family DNA binding protein